MGLYNLSMDRLWDFWLKKEQVVAPKVLTEPQMLDITGQKY